MASIRRFASVLDLVDAAFVTGTLTTIATGGALIGMGWREGESGRVFRLAGRAVLEWLGVSSASAPLTSVALGYLHHLTIATAWGVFFGLLVLPWRKAIGWLFALALSVIYVLLVTSVVPAPLRIGYGVTGSVSSVVPIGAALAVALFGGIWLSGNQHEAE